MGVDRKYGRVETEHGAIPDDEPVFIIRAQDAAAVDAIIAYHDVAQDVGAGTSLLQGVNAASESFDAWQAQHPNRVKTPD